MKLSVWVVIVFVLVVVGIDVHFTNQIYDYCKDFESFVQAPGWIHFYSWVGFCMVVSTVIGAILKIGALALGVVGSIFVR